ncbi:MAG TPA: MMPL family transporter [Acetobacteraceae bacterium]|jgi:hopanoid biosynthesis associated RND transporter like protein HpnN|nr:MMPL family transporter [Acetobacteraceae bacterium]
MLTRLLVGLADLSRRNALVIVLACAVLAAFSTWVAMHGLGISTDTDLMFAKSLPWRQRAIQFNRDFPQFNDLLVAVIDARIPEEADATAAALAARLSDDHAHFISVRRPDASPYLQKEGLLLLDTKQLSDLMDQTIDAQPFLGQLVADPTARGLFSALSLLGMGVTHGQADLTPYLGPISGFHKALADALAGHPQPLSWQSLLGGNVSQLAGPYRFVLVQPRQDYGSLEPGGEATKVMREDIAQLEFVKAGTARVRITGQVALADAQFASVAQGAVVGLIGSVLLITLWLFLAVHTWRLIIPILGTLALGLSLTLLFATLAVGTLNLVSVAFGVLFVGIAVDFAIQFSVRYRERRFEYPDPAEAMRQNARRVGGQILVAASATSAGFLAFVPTSFIGVAELGLIAGAGMLIAFACTMTFLPAAITLCRPPGEGRLVGFTWAAPLDPLVAHRRRPILVVAAVLAVLAAAVSPQLQFDSDPLDTQNPHTEPMETLRDLLNNPVTNPYSIDVLAPNVAEAEALAAKIKPLSTVSQVIDIGSFVPDDQQQKLAIIADAQSILAATLAPPATPPAPITPDQVRLAAKTALAQIEPALAKLPPDHPLAAIAGDLRQLQTASDSVAMATNAALTRFLPEELGRLRTALSAEPATLASIPPDMARDWLLPDGQARLQVTPKNLGKGSRGLRNFVDEVTRVAPEAGGPAVTIEATSDTIVGAFRDAAIYAVLAIAVILGVALRRLRDVALVLAPLILSALLTLLVAVLLPLPLNFANIIALPLLLGVGVSFNIYFVMNWRDGRRMLLGSATARAIVFSALTTSTAFGSLALSAHPGTRSMGDLLLISLACTLVASLIFIPALLASLTPTHTDR